MGIQVIAFFQGDLQTFELPENASKEGKITFFKARSVEENDIIVLGMGAKGGSAEQVRNCGGALARFLVTLEKDCCAELAEIKHADCEFVENFYEGFFLGAYKFENYYGSDHKSYEISVALSEWALSEDAVKEAVARANITASSVNFARDLTNELPDTLYPESFAEILKKRFKGTEIEVVIHKDKDLEKLELNGILSVGRGSARPPVLAELRYNTAPEKPLLALVGKGVTYDMGGVNMKVARDLSDTRMDMAGAAAVAGAFDLLLKRGAKANVIGLIPLVENLHGENAYLPSHVIKYKNGKTVQVANTDAEGRLILADGLLYAQEQGAKTAIDIATLTGNIGAALGMKIAGLFGEDSLAKTLCECGRATGDRLWQMPLMREYLEDFKSPYADLCNISTASLAGSIYAALFLEHFKGDMNWAHIDIAASSQAKTNYGYYPIGATGVGVRLFADYAAK